MTAVSCKIYKKNQLHRRCSDGEYSSETKHCCNLESNFKIKRIAQHRAVTEKNTKRATRVRVSSSFLALPLPTCVFPTPRLPCNSIFSSITGLLNKSPNLMAIHLSFSDRDKPPLIQSTDKFYSKFNGKVLVC